MSAKYVPPTPDEIVRVGEYWARVKALACKHKEITFDVQGARCADCERPLQILSDIQLEERQ